MKPWVKIVLIVFICILAASCIFSLLGTVLGIIFGAIGTMFGFLWRVIFSPIILIVLVVWIVSRVTNKRSSR